MLRTRYWGRLFAAVLFTVVLLSGCGSDTETQATGNTAVRLPDFTEIVKKVSPAVVNISTLPPESTGKNNGADGADKGSLENWLKRYFGSESQRGVPHSIPHPSLGSGFIISDDGYILTNRHVIRGAGRIVVKLSDRRQLLAEVIGTDKYSDVALLKVDATNLPTVEMGNPDQLEVGSWVLAIGSPFGFDTSVTAGIVSAKGRTLASEQYVPFIQTDVAINPGNSGGPLFNLKGQVVGINSQIYSRTGGYQGIAFAIPVDIAMSVAHQIKAQGRVKRGWLGVQIQNVSRELAQSFGLKRPRGALVARVFEDSPASGVGVHPGDIILKFNGQPIPTAGALPPLVGTLAPGSNVHMLILRDGNKEKFEVEIEVLPRDLTTPDTSTKQESAGQTTTRLEALGLTLKPLTADQRSRLALGDHGVRVTDVEDGAGARAGLQPGDIILAVGKSWLKSPDALGQRLSKANGPVALLVLRDGQRLYLALSAHSAATE